MCCGGWLVPSTGSDLILKAAAPLLFLLAVFLVSSPAAREGQTWNMRQKQMKSTKVQTLGGIWRMVY